MIIFITLLLSKYLFIIISSVPNMKQLLLVWICTLLLTWCSHQSQPLADTKFDEHHGHDMEVKKTQESQTGMISTIDLLKPLNPVAITTWLVDYFSGVQWYLAQPSSGKNLPAVVIIHEWRWLNDSIKQMADVIAMNGYRVLAVDLYQWQVAMNMDQAKALSSALDQSGATLNLLEAEKYMRWASSKVASLGWCLWGKQSLQLSMASDTLDATVVYYGRLPTDPQLIKNIDGPLLGIFAELDSGIPPSSVNEFEAILQQQGKQDYSIKIYSWVNHAFANPTGKAFAKEATLDAWVKTIQFLDKYLK